MTRRRYRFKNIRALLTQGFSDEDLRRLCLDEPAFRPVSNQLSREMGKDLIIDRLIDYACQNSLLDSLLSLLRDLNPARYEQHQPYEGEPDWDFPEIATYLAAVAEAHRYLPLEGSDQRIPLTDVFVMLQAAQIRPRRDVELTEQRREEMGLLERLGLKAKKEAEAKAEAETKSDPPPPPVEVSAVLREHPHLVILGEPGSGKTTLLRYIALCLATNQGEANLKLTEKYLPVFIELRDFNPDESLENFLRGKLSLQLSEAIIKEWQCQGRLLFLFDALDEAPPERRGKIRNRLNEFADSPKWKHNHFILTSRIAAYQESSDLSLERFSHFTLRPLTGANDARLYAEGWLQSLGKAEATLKGASAQAEAEKLIEYMSKQPGLRRVMSNPLQLRLAVIAYFEDGQAAVTNRAELYRQYLEKWLLKREKERGQRSEKSPPWQQVLTNLEQLAWARHTAPDGRLTQTQALALLGVEGFECIDYLRHRIGLIVIAGEEKGEPLLAFSHQTYQEYLVARVLSRAWQKGKQQREMVWRILKPRLHHPSWRETILLLAQVLEPAKASTFLRYIRNAKSSYEKVLHRDLLLALAGLASGTKVLESGKF